MKKTLIAFVAALALAFTVSTPIHAQSVSPVSVSAPSAPPRPLQFVNITLDASHAEALLTAYAAQPQTPAGLNAAVASVVTLPSGYTLVSARYSLGGSTSQLSLTLKCTAPVTSQ